MIALITPSMDVVLIVSALVFTVLMAWAIAAVRKNERWIMKLREERILKAEDPLAAVSDGLSCDDLHRILTSVAVEAREVRRLVEWLNRQWSATSAANVSLALENATGRMHALIGCVDALCERLQPEISEKEGWQ